MGQGCIRIGADSREFDLDKSFPDFPPGNLYIGFTGGVESTILLHILLERYPNHNIIPCTWRFGDRRLHEWDHARSMCEHLGIVHNHIEAGYLENSAVIATKPQEPDKYFNKENKLFVNFVDSDPTFVAGFSGKNTTLLDPEKITPEEQRKYVVWFKVHRPFLTYDKHHIVDLYYKMGVEDLLPFTHTCIRAIEKQEMYVRGVSTKHTHCGKCYACIERLEAFDRLGINDPAIYDGDYESLVHNARRYYYGRSVGR